MKKIVISVVVLFVLSMVLGFVIHATLLAGDYGRLPSLMRPQDEATEKFDEERTGSAYPSMMERLRSWAFKVRYFIKRTRWARCLTLIR